MKPGKVALSLWMASLACVFLQPWMTVRGDEVDVLKQIFARWKERQELVHTARARLAGKAVVPKGIYKGVLGITDDVPKNDEVYDEQFSFVLDFDHSRVRREERSKTFQGDMGIFIPNCVINIYDGKRFKAFAPRDENTDANYQPSPIQPDVYLPENAVSRTFFMYYENPLFFSFGTLPDTLLDPRKIRPGLRQNDFRLQGNGMRNDRKCIIIKRSYSNIIDEYWVDLERSAAICRWIVYYSGAITFYADINHKPTSNGWFPSDWTISNYNEKTKKLEISHTLHVRDLVINDQIDPKEFEIELKPRMIVDKDDDFYQVGDSGNLVLLPDKKLPRTHFPIWILYSALALFGLLLGFAAYRRVSKRNGARD
jgi:hypothetical protein